VLQAELYPIPVDLYRNLSRWQKYWYFVGSMFALYMNIIHP
jgi:hypothetical protein